MFTLPGPDLDLDLAHLVLCIVWTCGRLAADLLHGGPLLRSEMRAASWLASDLFKVTLGCFAVLC